MSDSLPDYDNQISRLSIKNNRNIDLQTIKSTSWFNETMQNMLRLQALLGQERQNFAERISALQKLNIDTTNRLNASCSEKLRNLTSTTNKKILGRNLLILGKMFNKQNRLSCTSLDLKLTLFAFLILSLCHNLL